MRGGESVQAFTRPKPLTFFSLSRADTKLSDYQPNTWHRLAKLARLYLHLILGCSLSMDTFFVRCFLVFNINQIIAIKLKRTRLIFHFESSLRTLRQVISTRFHFVLYFRCRQVLVFSSPSKFNVSMSFLDFSFCPLNMLERVRYQRVLPVLCEFSCCLHSRSLSYSLHGSFCSITAIKLEQTSRIVHFEICTRKR